jgi:hypothetical protein
MAERCTSLYGLSSAFLSPSVSLHFDRLSLAGLHRGLAITARRLATTPPPSSVPRAGIFAPHPWVKRYRSSPVPVVDVIAIRSCPLYAGCAVESSWSAPKHGQAGIVPFWVGRVSQFRPSMFTTFQTGVPFVSIDHKGSALPPSGWEMTRIVRRLRTSTRATTGRTLLPLHTMTHVRLSMSNINYR